MIDGMIADLIRERLKAEPFEPFRIRSSSDKSIVVASPDLAVVMKSEVFVAAPNSDKWAQIPFLHVASIESVSNGRRKKRPKRRE